MIKNKEDNPKVVVVLRSVSGGGKSTFADYILTLSKNDAKICCADDYFEKDGEYRFDITKLGAAHEWCRNQFSSLIELGAQDIVVANTNCSEKEFSFYKDTAEENGYRVFVVVIENRHGNKDIHGVPDVTLAHQENKLRNSIKLR